MGNYADGREGFQNIFLRQRFGVYLIDQPRRGDAGRSMVEATLKPTPDEQLWFNQFRMGLWPNYFEGVQVARDRETLDQFFRSMTPNFEPGSSFIFLEGEVPTPIPSAFDTVQGASVPMSQFRALTRIPILVVYGDNIPAQAIDLPAQDSWRARLQMARLWRDTANKHGGDVTLVHLPEIGIRGNTHFPFSDLNNRQIADLVSQFLARKGLD